MSDENEPKLDDRRAFLSAAGKFALTVPPAMTFLLSTTLSSEAIAQSGSCNRGLGNNSEGCDPGNSGGKPGAAGEDNEGNGPNGERWPNPDER